MDKVSTEDSGLLERPISRWLREGKTTNTSLVPTKVRFEKYDGTEVKYFYAARDEGGTRPLGSITKYYQGGVYVTLYFGEARSADSIYFASFNYTADAEKSVRLLYNTPHKLLAFLQQKLDYWIRATF